jgi:hypothetical protein
MIKSACHIPHHVAIRIFVYAPPRCFSAENSGARGRGTAASGTVPKKKKKKKNPHSWAKVEPYSRIVWANSIKVIPPLLILDGPFIIDSRFRSSIV